MFFTVEIFRYGIKYKFFYVRYEKKLNRIKGTRDISFHITTRIEEIIYEIRLHVGLKRFSTIFNTDCIIHKKSYESCGYKM